MKTTDTNINNPFKIDTIDLLREIPSWDNPTIERCSQNFYDQIGTKDPNTFYIMTDSNKKYLGDMLISNGDELNNKYLIGINDYDINKYEIYHIFYSDINYVCEFDDMNSALDFIRISMNAGNHKMIPLYKLLVNYINEEMSCYDLIIGIFVIFGYKENPVFQNMVNTLSTFKHYPSDQDNPKGKDLPIRLREDIRGFRDSDKNILFKIYSSIYDIIIKYNFFSDIDKENINLSKAISEINSLFN